MDRSEAMASGAAFASPEGEAPSCVLLDVGAYSAARRNASTVKSTTSNGHPIEVTFFTARPPVLSSFSVHCPGLQLQDPVGSPMAPKVIATDADLVLFRVPIDALTAFSHLDSDYFVYRAHPQNPELDLLPNPSHDCLGDNELAIVSCAGDKQYVVASLKINVSCSTTFTLHLYRSKPGGEQGSWTTQLVSVDEPLRDRVCPIPSTAQRLMYHLTTKVITLGGANGTVGWVDLWRGILLCDVLEPNPKLRDMPLPLPARLNWTRFLNVCPHYTRDITVSQHKDSIKYVEMEIVPPRIVASIPPGDRDPDSYLEWVRRRECQPQTKLSLVPGCWKVSIWSMPIPVASWDDWRVDCSVKSTDLHVDNPRDYELLCKMSSSHKEEEDSDTTLSLGCLRMAHPTLSIDEDVVYLMTRATKMGKNQTGVVTAVDVRREMLRGVAKLDSKKNTAFMRCYLASGISIHLNTTGTRRSLGQAEEQKQKPTSRRRRRRRQASHPA